MSLDHIESLGQGQLLFLRRGNRSVVLPHGNTVGMRQSAGLDARFYEGLEGTRSASELYTARCAPGDLFNRSGCPLVCSAIVWTDFIGSVPRKNHISLSSKVSCFEEVLTAGPGMAYVWGRLVCFIQAEGRLCPLLIPFDERPDPSDPFLPWLRNTGFRALVLIPLMITGLAPEGRPWILLTDRVGSSARMQLVGWKLSVLGTLPHGAPMVVPGSPRWFV
jgi:hypothetical protein